MGSTSPYENMLEQQFYRLPGIFQAPLRGPFDWVDHIVKDIAGDPQALLGAGQGYAALSKRIDAIATEQAQDRSSILSGAWEGKAYDAFSQQMSGVEQEITNVGKAAGQVQPVLAAAAQACTQSADVIVEIIEGFVSFVLTDLAISVVTSFLDFGASLAAGIAAALGRFAEIADEIGGVIARLAAFLRRLASLLEDVENVLKTAIEWINNLKSAIKNTEGLKSLALRMARGGIAAAGRDAVSGIVDHGTFPGPAGAGAGVAVHTGLGLHDAATGGQEAAG